MPVRYNFRWNKHDHVRRSARSLGEDVSLFFAQEPWTPAIDNMEGRVTYFDPARVAAVRKRLKGVNKKRYLQDILARILKGADDDKDRVARICGFVSDALYYNPIQQPVEDHTGTLIEDAVELLEYHDGRCGQGVVMTVALLEAAGIECRLRHVHHHVTCEARYGGKWHLADALMFGAEQPEHEGRVVNVAFLRRDPYFADAFPLRCFVYTPEELLSRDGYRMLGYSFGDWGSLAYYSWYMGGELDYPPFLPVYIPPIRLPGDRVRLRWAPSGKRNGGTVRYRVTVYRDRARSDVAFTRTQLNTTLVYSVPESNHMYFVGIQAIDDHLERNARTWYPEAVGNFVLAPPDQYGWYGVL
jgi:transglutaminase superfamily protein